MTTHTLAIDPDKDTLPDRVRFPDSIIVEIPCWQKGDTPSRINDLLITAFRAGETVRDAGETCQSLRIVRPRDWKGSVPKDLHNERVLKALTTEERAIVFAACDAGGKKVSVSKL